MRSDLLLFAALLASAPVMAADNLPKLKAGQWEMTSLSSRGDKSVPTRTTMCTDEALQKEIVSMGSGMRKDMCSKSDIKRDGARVTTTAECKIGESTIKSRAVMTLSGETGYKTEISASYDPPFMGMKDSKTTLEGRYVGPCKDGLVPGDFITPSGQKINLKGMAERKAALPPGLPAPATRPAAPPPATPK